MTLALSTRTAAGRALTWAEVDANFAAIQSAVNALQAAGVGVGIASITQPSPGTITITLTDATTASFSLPVAAIPAPVVAALSGTTGTVSLDPTTLDVATVTPSGDMTINASATTVKRLSVIITTSGTTSRTVTFGTNFKANGTLATGSTSGKIWSVDFVSNGAAFVEFSRSGPL